MKIQYYALLLLCTIVFTCSFHYCTSNLHQKRFNAINTKYDYQMLKYHNHLVLHEQQSSGNKNEKKIDKFNTNVPSGLRESKQLLQLSLSESLSQKPHKKLLSVDLLTPGLNPRLENQAICLQEYLFDVITSIIPSFTIQNENGNFRRVKFMFSSSGEAAGFQKYCQQNGVQIPLYMELSELDGKKVGDFVDCLVFIAARY